MFSASHWSIIKFYLWLAVACIIMETSVLLNKTAVIKRVSNFFLTIIKKVTKEILFNICNKPLKVALLPARVVVIWQFYVRTYYALISLLPDNLCDKLISTECFGRYCRGLQQESNWRKAGLPKNGAIKNGISSRLYTFPQKLVSFQLFFSSTNLMTL